MHHTTPPVLLKHTLKLIGKTSFNPPRAVRIDKSKWSTQRGVTEVCWTLLAVKSVWVSSPCMMPVQYTGVVQCTGGYAIHWGDIISTLGDIMSILGVLSTLQGFHEYTEGIPWLIMGRSLINPSNLYRNPGVLNTPHCTHDNPLLYLR